MAIEQNVFDATKSLFGADERVFLVNAPPGVAHPYMTYQNVGGVPSNTLCGDTTQQNAHLQFNIWCNEEAGGQKQANTLMRSVAAVLTAAPLRGVSLGSLVAIFDEITKNYGARQEFSFWE